MNTCPHCGQPMPDEPRRDPPLPPLDYPNVVTIHDLPEGVPAKVEVTEYGHRFHGVKGAVRRLVLDPPSNLERAG